MRWKDKLGKRLGGVGLYEKLHKTDKGKGDWCDIRSKKVATMYKEATEVADGVDAPADLTFDPEAWVKVIGVPKKKGVYGFALTQEAKSIHNHATSYKKRRTSSNSTIADNEAIIEAQVNARVEATIESHVEARVERRLEKVRKK